MQLSEDKVLGPGIIRMLVEAIDPQAGLRGWVTRTAEKAGGPCYFKPANSGNGREPHMVGKIGDNKGHKGGGYRGKEKGGHKGDSECEKRQNRFVCTDAVQLSEGNLSY